MKPKPQPEASRPWRLRIGALALIALMVASTMVITPAAADRGDDESDPEEEEPILPPMGNQTRPPPMPIDPTSLPEPEEPSFVQTMSHSTIIRDDDGAMDDWYDHDLGDDVAVKRLVIPSGGLSGVGTAKLWIFAEAHACGTTGNAHRLYVNGLTAVDYNSCNKWGTSGFSWASLDVSVSLLTAGATNSFEVREIAGTWTDRNHHFAYDDDSNFGRSDMTECNATGCTSPTGELMWYLELFNSGSGTGDLTEGVDFENGAPGWNLNGLWHISTRRSVSGSQSLGYANPSTNTYDTGATNSGTATSSAFTVPSNGELTFQSWYQTESTLGYYDRLDVLISTNGGTSWTCLASSYTACEHTATGTPADLASTMNQWNQETIDLSSYAGQTALIRFSFDTLDSVGNAYEGWFIDDAEVAVPAPDTTLPTSSGATVTTAWSDTNPWLSGVCFQDSGSGLDDNAQYWMGTSSGFSDLKSAASMPTQPTPGQSSWCPIFKVDGTALQQGLNYVTMQVTDVAGNTGAPVNAYVVRYDSVAEDIASVDAYTSNGGSAIAASTWQSDRTPYFDWPDVSSMSPEGYSYTLSTSSFVNPDSTQDTTSSDLDRAGNPLSDGTWFFKVKAVDDAGNAGGVKGFTLKVDATDPVFSSLSSSTHPDPSRFYNRTSATVSWSASDARSGVVEYHYEVVDGACPSSLSSPTTTTTTTASVAVPGAFKKYRFCIEAEDQAGNVGAIQSLNLFVDTTKPDFTLVDPFNGEQITDPLRAIEIDYGDDDAGLDNPLGGPSETIVDVDSVEFFIDGVDVRAAWSDLCGPGGLLYPTACKLEVTAGGIDYEPLLPWEEGRHDMFVSATDTVAAGGNTAKLSSSFLLQCTGSTDADCDHTNDQVEEELCTRAVFYATLIPATEDLGHSCAGDDYRPAVVTLLVPTGVQEGPDADGDGLPEYVRIEQTAVTVDVASATLLGTSGAPDEVVSLDSGATGDDQDPNDPVQSIVTSPFAVPTGYEIGEDADGDGLPRTVSLKMSTVVFDRRNPTNPVTFEPEPDQVHHLDDAAGVGDDSDPENPAPSVVALPVELPYDIVLGPDEDNDDVPAHVEVKYRTYTFDRRQMLNPISSEEASSEFYEIDGGETGDDSDPNSPAQSTFSAAVPTNAWHNGDGDDDYIPASVTVEYTIVDVDRTKSNPVSMSTRTETTTVDSDDGDRDSHVPFSVVDGDNDDVPDDIEPVICLVEDGGDPIDGTCTSDLQDYTPPDGDVAPNPWNMV